MIKSLQLFNIDFIICYSEKGCRLQFSGCRRIICISLIILYLPTLLYLLFEIELLIDILLNVVIFDTLRINHIYSYRFN